MDRVSILRHGYDFFCVGGQLVLVIQLIDPKVYIGSTSSSISTNLKN